MEYLAHLVEHDVSAVTGRDSVDTAHGGIREVQLHVELALEIEGLEACVACDTHEVAQLLVCDGQFVAWLDYDFQVILLEVDFDLDKHSAVNVGK